MGLLDWLTGWFSPEVAADFSWMPTIDYGPTDLGFTYEPFQFDPAILSGASGGSATLPYAPDAYVPFPLDPTIVSGRSGGSVSLFPAPVDWGEAMVLTPSEEKQLARSLSGGAGGGTGGGGRSGAGGGAGGGGGGSNVGLNALLNLPPSDIPDVPRLSAPSLEAPGPLPATPEPVPFSPLTVETTTPAQAPRMLDRLAGSQALFPEARTRALQRMYGV